jgi:hypothetical protein
MVSRCRSRSEALCWAADSMQAVHTLLRELSRHERLCAVCSACQIRQQRYSRRKSSGCGIWRKCSPAYDEQSCLQGFVLVMRSPCI